MRDKLVDLNGVRKTFEGSFVRFGTKRAFKGYPIPTMLLRDIRDAATGQTVTDHIWFAVGKRLSKLQLQVNDLVRFDARVTPYIKGYRGYRDDIDLPCVKEDFRLSFPTNIAKIPSNSSRQERINL